MKKIFHARGFPLLAAALAAIVVIVVALVAQHFLWIFALQESERDHVSEMDRNAFLLAARVRGRANDMFFLKRVAEQELVHDPGAPVDGEIFRSAVTTMMLARSQYNTVRLLDLSGHETFRYNWKDGPNPLEEVPLEKLQDKSGRPYYRSTLAAPPNAAVFSPLDLDVDNGQIVQPLRPVIRVSGQILGPDGTPRALLVLNYLGDQLMRELKLSKDPNRQMMMLNSDGYWLVGPHSQSEWAFMFPERKNESLMERNPSLWKKITSSKSGTFDEGGNQFCYLKVDPVGSAADYPPLRMQVIGAGKLQWILLTKVPNAIVWAKVRGIGLSIWLGCAAVIFTLVPMTWLGLSSTYRRRLAMAEMQTLTERAQAAERAKGEFLAVMSHEIRTPMNGVIGMASILADTELNDMQSDCVTTIQTSGESLLAVINNILDFSKIESQRMTLECRPFDLQKCVEETMDLFAWQMREKALEGVYLIGAAVPPRLNGDVTRLRQILVNLIGNAVKFTARGDIVLEIELQAKSENGYELLFSVTDTGLGIAPEGLEKLFHAFQQVDASTTRKFGGTGLGLAISKNLAELMGGRMWVESELGKGSTFYFTALVTAADSSQAEASRTSRMFRTLSILIVDDHPISRRSLEAQCATWRMLSASAPTGEEALASMAQGKFDVVLIDFRLPDMEGVVLAREIRRTSQVPLVLMSRGEMVAAENASLFQDQIQKPIRHSLLFAMILRLSGAKQQDSLPSEKNFDGHLAERNPLRIMLAEDNVINQKVGVKMLLQFGYSADLAGTGIEAIALASESDYDLVLMDIQMPEMGGVDAARIIREQRGVRCPYLVALTAEALSGDRERFLASGFDDYLSKPLQAKALQEMLQKVPARQAASSK